jgi:hypothetical protein
MLLTGDLRSVRRSEAGGGEWRGRLGRAQSVVMDRGQKTGRRAAKAPRASRPIGRAQGE